MTKQVTFLLNVLLSASLTAVQVQCALAQHPNGKSLGGCPVPVPLNTPINSPNSTACSNDSTGTCLDATFGGGGLVITNTDGSVPKTYDVEGAQAVKQLTDGTSRLIAIGTTTDPQTKHQDVAAIRYNADGSLDSSFGSGGISIAFVSSSQPDSTVDGGIDSNGNTIALVNVNGTAVAQGSLTLGSGTQPLIPLATRVRSVSLRVPCSSSPMRRF